MTARPAVVIVAPGMRVPGGQAVQARALADGLRGDGYRVRLLTIDRAFPGPLARLRRVRGLRTLLNQALYLPALLALGRAHVALIFCASYWSFLLAAAPALLAARALSRRAVLVYHSGEVREHLAGWGVWVHAWLGLAHRIVAPSAFVADAFADHGYRTTVIPNVVDTSRFRFRERAALRPRLLSTRNLEPLYHVERTIAAFALVKQRHPTATLIVAGSGTQEQELRRIAAEKRCSGITFTGAVRPEDMPALYDSADVFLNASAIDNQPVSVLEAFAAGLPVVSTCVGDIPAMTRHGQAGVLVPSGEPVDLAQAVCGLLDDPQRARTLARNARAEIERYRWEAVRAQWEKICA